MNIYSLSPYPLKLGLIASNNNFRWCKVSVSIHSIWFRGTCSNYIGAFRKIHWLTCNSGLIWHGRIWMNLRCRRQLTSLDMWLFYQWHNTVYPQSGCHSITCMNNKGRCEVQFTFWEYDGFLSKRQREWHYLLTVVCSFLWASQCFFFFLKTHPQVLFSEKGFSLFKPAGLCSLKIS